MFAMALQESPVLAKLASVDSSVQVMSSFTECLPHPLHLFHLSQTCSSFRAKLQGIILQKPSLMGLCPGMSPP